MLRTASYKRNSHPPGRLAVALARLTLELYAHLMGSTVSQIHLQNLA